MPDETIFCPSCQRKLRVPEQQLGQAVQCPLCRVIFVAPRQPTGAPQPEPATPAPVAAPPQSVAVPTNVEAAEEPEEPAASPEEIEKHLEIYRKVLVPATALLMSGVLSVVAELKSLNDVWEAGPEGIVRAAEQMREKLPPEWAPFATSPASPELHYAFQLTLHSVLFLVALGVVLGAVQILRLRSYAWGIAGCILSFVSLAIVQGVCCCFLSAPFGLWSLIVLLNADVRNAFE